MRLSSQRVLVLVMVATLALCMVPNRALGLGDLLSEALGLVLQPFAVMGGQLAEWIRPAPSGIEGPLNEEFVKHLQQEHDEVWRLYVVEQAKVESLEEQVRQLQMGASEPSQAPVKRLGARVALRSPAPLGIVTLNRGSNDGVHEGVIAVFNGTHLLGRIVKVSAMQCELLPLANKSTGLVDGVIMPADHQDMVLKNRPRVQLTPSGNGTLRGDVDRATVVNAGDLVQLLDDAWLHPAQGMFIGKVESVGPKESEPLRNTITVRPQFDVSQVAYVTLKIEMEESATQPANRSSPERKSGSATTAPAAQRSRGANGGSGGGRP